MPQSVLLHPFELYIAGLALLTAIPLVVGQPAPQTINALLPLWLVKVWGVELAVGAGLVVAGLLRPRSRLERLGHSLLAPAAMTYGAAIVTVLGVTGVLAGGIVIAFGIACMTRAYVLRLAEDVISQALRLDRDLSVEDLT
jgi:hypothetical protein